MKTLHEMQVEQEAWVKHNFGETEGFVHEVTHPLLGIFEELLEHKEAVDEGSALAVADAIGDVMIYMLDYCTMIDINADMLLYTTTPNTYSVPQMICMLSKHTLKYIQHIRGDRETHKAAIIGYLKSVIAYLKDGDGQEHSDLEILEITNEVWEEVRKRDWKKNSANGGAV